MSDKLKSGLSNTFSASLNLADANHNQLYGRKETFKEGMRGLRVPGSAPPIDATYYIEATDLDEICKSHLQAIMKEEF